MPLRAGDLVPNLGEPLGLVSMQNTQPNAHPTNAWADWALPLEG